MSKVKKVRRGRKAKIVRKTKLNAIMKKRDITRQDLVSRINSLYPESRISPDAVTRIASGDRTDYKLSTLYRLCSALNLSPNQILDWEREVIKKNGNEESEESND